LGIFGNSYKGKTVLTNKVFQILASQKPLITMESSTTVEANLKNGSNCMLVPPSSPEKLAEAILFLKNNPEKLEQIAVDGYQTYKDHMSMNKVGERLVRMIQDLLSKKGLS